MSTFIRTFRKKPVIVSAVQYKGTTETLDAVVAFAGSAIHTESATSPGGAHFLKVSIDTLEGRMEVRPRAYVIEGVQGEFYPCAESIFLETYEEVTA